MTTSIAIQEIGVTAWGARHIKLPTTVSSGVQGWAWVLYVALELSDHLLATSDLIPRCGGIFSTGLVRVLFEPLLMDLRECRVRGKT